MKLQRAISFTVYCLTDYETFKIDIEENQIACEAVEFDLLLDYNFFIEESQLLEFGSIYCLEVRIVSKSNIYFKWKKSIS